MVDPITEGAKAATEIAKTAGKAIDASRELGYWFDGKTGRALEEAIGWAVTDNIRRSRELREVRHRERLAILMHQTEARLTALGSPDVSPPPDTTTVPLIEAAALEDDPRLQALWAGLLATALTSEQQDYRHFVGILKELRSTDAEALTAYYQRRPDTKFDPGPEQGNVKYPPITMTGELYGLEVTRALARVGLVEAAPMHLTLSKSARSSYGRSEEPSPFEVIIAGDLYGILLTPTGMAFCEAVGIPQTEDNQSG